MKGDIRKAKANMIIETKHDLIIADLRVMTNPKIPNGVMVVSPKEGERLADMVVNTAKRKQAEAESIKRTVNGLPEPNKPKSMY